jgi:hypothetical protein
MPRKSKSKVATPPPKPELLIFETFRKVGSYESSQLTQDQPSCMNGDVRYKRYRVTFEEIVEPVEVYRDRITKMWKEGEFNQHHWDPLRRAGAEVGLTDQDLKADEFRKYKPNKG